MNEIEITLEDIEQWAKIRYGQLNESIKAINDGTEIEDVILNNIKEWADKNNIK